jgi:hypothetical protein
VYNISRLSHLYRIICQKNLSGVVKSVRGELDAFKDVLSVVYDVAQHEVFGSRLLSLDLVTMFRLFYTLFEKFRSTIPGMEKRFKTSYNRDIIDRQEKYRVNIALESSVMTEMLGILDLDPSERRNPGVDLGFVRNVAKHMFETMNNVHENPRFLVFPDSPEKIFDDCLEPRSFHQMKHKSVQVELKHLLWQKV